MVSRGVVAFGLVVIVLIAAAAACGAPVTTGRANPQSTADAQATNVRRTAVADAQRIIANNPQPTPTAAATPIPRPSCPNAIWWHEARAHLGEARTVQGAIVGARPSSNGGALLELGQPYPDPTGVGVVLGPQTRAPDVNGKTVCVTGRINSEEGRPTMQLRDSSSIVVVN